MGRASKWFRAIFGLKPDKKTKAWSYGKKPSKDFPRKSTPNCAVENSIHNNDDEASKHAIAVAAATAAVAEAAVAAAQAAAAVVKLTSGGANLSRQFPSSHGGAGYQRENVSREEWAAVVVQSHFRAYLARRALRALKGLVKIQALVRGHLVRKQTAYALRRLQALIRAQDRARSGRVTMSESPHSTKKSSHFNYAGPATPEKSEHVVRAKNLSKNETYASLKRNSSKSNSGSNYDSEVSHTSHHTRMDSYRKNGRTWEHGSLTKTLSTDDAGSDKILEVDTISQNIIPKRKNLFHSSHLSISSEQNCQSFSTSKDSVAHQSVLSPSSCEVQSSIHFGPDVEEAAFYTADNSPQFNSSASMGGDCCRRETFTPTRSCLSGYSDYPNYMVCTESSKAKVRSLSAPKQRPNYERTSSTKRYSVHGAYGDSRSHSQRATQNLHANFADKAYPGSGRLDRLGMPVRGDTRGFSGGLWHRY